MSSQSVHIEKLKKDNYDTWKLQIEAVLIKNDKWGFVDGTEVKPPAEDAVATAAWVKSDKKARADIILAMEPSELCHVKHCATSKEVWAKLVEVYQSKGPARKATLLKQLLFSKMGEGDNMTEHLNKFFNTVDRLTELEIEVSDDLLAILLLYSVPSSYENFRCAIEARDDLPAPEALKIKLIEEFEARKGKEGSQPSQDALYAGSHDGKQQFQRRNFKDGNSSKNSSNANPKKRYKCGYCNKMGHKAADCWKKKAEQMNSASTVEEAMITDVVGTESCENKIAATTFNVEKSTDAWCIDSGATSHMCRDRGKFSNLESVSNQKVRLATDETTEVIGKGVIHLEVPNENGKKKIRLENTLCVPGLRTNLLSIVKAVANGRSVTFDESCAKIKDREKKTIAVAQRKGDLYFLEPMNECAAVVCESASELEKLHQRYGHLNEADLKKLVSKNMVEGISQKIQGNLTCEICILGKQTASPFPKASNTKSEALLELIHSDVCGPMRVPSIGGSRYFVTFIDEKSRWVEVRFLKAKSDVKPEFLKFKAFVETQKGKKVKILRTDNGLEYCGSEFTEILEEMGLKRECTVAYTPQQNGTAERMNRTLVEMARCMLLQAKLGSKFWAEAISTAAYIRNRSPTRALENQTPFEVWFNKKPNVSNLQIFGCKAYALDKTKSKGKFDPRSKPCIFVGYASDAKAYRLWSLQDEQIIKSRDVQILNVFEKQVSQDEEDKFLNFEIFFEDTNVEENPRIQEITVVELDGEDVPVEDDLDQQLVRAEEPPPPILEQQPVFQKRGPGRPKIIRTGLPGRPKKEFKLVETHEAQLTLGEPVDVSVREALTGPYSQEWKNSMEEEFNALKASGAWILVQRPENRKIIGCRWVLRTKFKADGTIERRKARLVAKGCSQQPGIDFQETFSPVSRLSSIRIIVALSSEYGLTLYQLDVVMAYINGHLEEEIFMEQPEEFVQPGGENLVCSLKRAIYGLKQSGRQWYKRLDQRLREIGFETLNVDKCVYMKATMESVLIIVVYVDDLIVATDNDEAFDQLKRDLGDEFKIKDLGILHYCIGIEFQQDPATKSVMMSQQKYIQDILVRFGMEQCKPVSTPLDGKVRLTKKMAPTTNEEVEEMSEIPYQSLVGALMYLTVATRPDLAYTVNLLSQFNTNPGKEHWQAAKRVLRYLKGTSNHGLDYKKSSKPLFGFVDADWGADLDDRSSHTGFVFQLAGAAVTWESRKQRTVALSSTEAEYVALSEATKEAVYLRNFLKEVKFSKLVVNATMIYCDNQGAQSLMRNPVHHSRTKHIDIRYHYVRQVFEKGDIDVNYIPTNEMVADVLTKGLPKPGHEKCIKGLGVKALK